MEYLARIRPTSPRALHVVGNIAFRKEIGWYGPIPEALAVQLRLVPENELNPMSSERVFEVKAQAEAAVVAEQERKVDAPAGTPEAPRAVDPSAPGAAGQPAATSRRLAGSGAAKGQKKDDGPSGDSDS